MKRCVLVLSSFTLPLAHSPRSASRSSPIASCSNQNLSASSLSATVIAVPSSSSNAGHRAIVTRRACNDERCEAPTLLLPETSEADSKRALPERRALVREGKTEEYEDERASMEVVQEERTFPLRERWRSVGRVGELVPAAPGGRTRVERRFEVKMRSVRLRRKPGRTNQSQRRRWWATQRTRHTSVAR